MISIVKFFHRLYRKFVSPLFGNVCRFHPSCSDYAVEALEVHGFFYGSFLTLRRIIRCQPSCQGGFDPVPTKGLRE